MGRTKVTRAQSTCVMAWAETAVFLGGGGKSQYLSYFAESGASSNPRTFYACLNKGVPAPRFRLSGGEEGPALKIERHVPGSLKWLIHPLWPTFDSPCESIFDVHRLMAALEPSVVDRLFDPASPLLRRSSRALRPFCEELSGVGTLDALAALIYCGYEALLANDLTVARAVERTLRQRLFDWPCVQQLSDKTKRHLLVLCRDAVDASSLQPPRREDAPWAVAASIVAKRFRGVMQDESLGSAEDIAHIERVLTAQ